MVQPTLKEQALRVLEQIKDSHKVTIGNDEKLQDMIRTI